MKIDIKEFLRSKWYRRAEEPDADEYVREHFGHKIRKVGGKLAELAGRLYEYFRDPEVSAKKKILIIAGLVYFINPFDMIPDLLPVLGYTDDVAVLAAVLGYLTKELKERGDATRAQTRAVAEPQQSKVIRPKQVAVQEAPKRHWRSRLIGFFVDDYVKELSDKAEAETQRYVTTRLRVIVYALVGVIAACCISLIYWYLKTRVTGP